jgi:hypothetical protein
MSSRLDESLGQSKTLIMMHKIRLAPRRGIRNPLRSKSLRVPTPEIHPVGFQGLTGNVPTRSFCGDALDEQVCERAKFVGTFKEF